MISASTDEVDQLQVGTVGRRIGWKGAEGDKDSGALENFWKNIVSDCRMLWFDSGHVGRKVVYIHQRLTVRDISLSFPKRIRKNNFFVCDFNIGVLCFYAS